MSEPAVQSAPIFPTWLSSNTLKFGALYGALAAVLNVYALIPIYGQLTLHLGQAVVLLCLLARGVAPALFASAIASTALALAIDNWLFVLLLPLEIGVVYWLRGRQVAWVMADLLYWCLVGIPIAAVYIVLQTQFPADYTLLVLLKQLLNGMLYTLLASVVVMLMPMRWMHDSRLYSIPKLSNQLMYLASVCIILPALLVAIVLTTRDANDYEAQIKQEMQAKARELGELTSTYIQHHMQAVKTVASVAGQSMPVPPLLDATQEQFSGFISMLVTDHRGQILHAAPEALYARLLVQPESLRNVADRDYFTQPRANNAVFVSDVFQGRGFGNDTILALSAPIMRGGEFVGVAEGSLNLAVLKQITAQPSSDLRGLQIVITDKNDNVIRASDSLALDALAAFRAQSVDNPYSNTLPMLQLDAQSYLYQHVENRVGWNIYLLRDPAVITRMFVANTLILAVCLAVITGLFMVITRRFSRQVTEPLVMLTRSFRQQRLGQSIPASAVVSDEVKQIAGQLRDAQNVMLDFHQRLEDEVERKTEELQELNHQLTQQASEDSLTGLANRRSFDQQARQILQINTRNRQQTSLVMLDIDHFKTINDNHGHPCGDAVIRHLADTIGRFFSRTSDISGRYGGEEFVLLMAGGQCASHMKQLEYFRKAIEMEQVFFEDKVVKYTISLGAVCLVNDFDHGYEALLKQADQQLYLSKSGGRNQLTQIQW